MISSDPFLVAKNLSIGYSGNGGRKSVFDRLNLGAHRGEIVALIGRNGVGKSTLLRTLAGLQPCLQGDVVLNGRNIQKVGRNQRARLVSFVPSESVVVPNLSIRRFVSMGRYPYAGWSNSLSKADWLVVDRSIENVGLASLQHRDLSMVSDGERHRAMIAFALAQDSGVVLLDEPTAFLDLPNKFETVRLLAQMSHEQQKLVVFSTHDLQVALGEVDSIWLMDGGTFTTGIPEELVLNGQIGGLLADSRVVFDLEAGVFRNQRAATRNVALLGEGTGYLWTKRMLERLGYAVNKSQEVALRVKFFGHDGSGVWELYRAGHFQGSCSNLSELLILLQDTI